MSEEKINTPVPGGRPLFDHRNNKFNREHIDVATSDQPSSDGANHEYTISLKDSTGHFLDTTVLRFQNGGLKEVGPNGITDQALLAIVLDRIRGWNDGPFRCRENSVIITKLEEAMMWMEKRGNDRARRGVEGERRP